MIPIQTSNKPQKTISFKNKISHFLSKKCHLFPPKKTNQFANTSLKPNSLHIKIQANPNPNQLKKPII
jgi:hypothetical protein